MAVLSVADCFEEDEPELDALELDSLCSAARSWPVEVLLLGGVVLVAGRLPGEVAAGVVLVGVVAAGVVVAGAVVVGVVVAGVVVAGVVVLGSVLVGGPLGGALG